MIRRCTHIALVVAMGVVVSACGGDPRADDTTAAATPAAIESSSAGGQPAAVAQGRWWAWAAAEPEGRDPVSDPTGDDCARNQPAEVWFLAGTFGGEARRRCTVPAGRPLLAPAVNLFSEAATDCAEFMRTATGEVLVDGAAVTLDRIDGERVEFTGVFGNAVGTDADPIRATGCGLWARIPGLAPGTHVVRIQGKAGTFATSVEYTLQV